ncbi:MAG TPA: MlaD family protein [Gemmatimonadaceae bacterium]|jgi:ABC-type transporter Mla subunit MlaD|nr:MlaD family protein [Gemmatimonadaceae bacterium]
MSRRLRWRNLALGVASAAVVLTVALLILVYGRVGTLRGKTFRIYVTTDAARGVIRGTEVWLDGQKVGLVKNVDFRAASTSTKERLVLSLEMLDVARSHVRADSRVDIRAGGTLIGNQVVYITSGTAKNAVIADGDTLQSRGQSDLESAVSKAAVAAREFPAVMANVKVLAAQLQSAQGTIGAVMGLKGDVKFGAVRARTERVIGRLSSSSGTISLALSDSALLRARVQAAMARADSIRQLLASDSHSLGRFRKDSTLARDVADIRSELGRVRSLLNNPDGTIGRLRTDSALVRAVHRDFAAFDSLFTDLKKHPLRYIAF